MIYELKSKGFWLDEAVDKLLDYLKEQGMDKGTIVCAAGMTPSAPIHFGILREIAVSSFVADELVRRCKKTRLIYYWDDYDHFCKIPYYTTREKVAEHIGKTLDEVPDFNGNFQSYGEHYMRDFEKCLHFCGFFPDYNYQARLYKSGWYTDFIRKAIKNREKIFRIVHHSKDLDSPEMQERCKSYYPLEIYCEHCGKDSTRTTGYDESSDTVSYECKECGKKGSYVLGKNFRGKLAWKINWATRWTDDGVCFESSGENQLTDTGSYSVSSRIATEIFGGKVPFSLLYRFIGMPGIAKVSRAQGEKTLANNFVKVLEPAIIRWLLVKNPPNKAFSVDIDGGIVRIYHEWDVFCEKIEGGECTETERRIYQIATQGVEMSRVRVPFKTITTSLGITGGDREKTALQMSKIVSFGGTPEELYMAVRPRINAAAYWLYHCGHTETEPSLRRSFNKNVWNTLPENIRGDVAALRNSVERLTTENEAKQTLYGIVCDDAERREFFRALYLLILDTERGPKLATLLCLMPKEKLLMLLGGDEK